MYFILLFQKKILVFILAGMSVLLYTIYRPRKPKVEQIDGNKNIEDLSYRKRSNSSSKARRGKPETDDNGEFMSDSWSECQDSEES